MKIQNIILINDRLFIGYNFLIDNDVPVKTFEKWKKRCVGIIIKRNNRNFIDYDTIPAPTRAKLPSKAQLVAKIDLDSKAEKLEDKQTARFLIENQISEVFKNAIDREAVRFNPIYGKYFTNTLKITAYGVEHAVCLACVELNNNQPKFKLKDIHRVYKDLPYKWLITNYTRFTIAFKRWSCKDFNLVHGLTGRAANNANATRLTDFSKARIEEYYKHPNQYTFEMIHKLVSIECARDGSAIVSLSTVKTYINKPENKNRLSYYRNPQHYNRVVMPTIRRKNVQQAGDLYYGDGTPLQIFCWNKAQTEKIRLNLFAVQDVASGKIVGFDLAESEDRYNIIAALKMAFDLEKLVPFEYKYDNASPTKTEEYNALKEAMLLKGCLFTPTKKGNPKEKSQIERFFNTFQSKYQRMVDGFIGEGIKSKRDNGRIRPEFLKKCQSKDNLYTYESMCKIVAQLITIYNLDNRRNKQSPDEVFAKSEKARATKIDATDIALLFWAHKTIKVSKSEIATTIRHNDYIFDVFDHATALKVSGKQVKMYYDEKDLSSVHLFDLEGKFLCECRQKVRIHEGEAGRTEENTLTLIKQSKHAAAMDSLIKKQTISIKNKGKSIATGDTEIKLLNPFDVAKEEINEAETGMYNYLIHQKGIDFERANDYVPIYTDAEKQQNINKYSKKYKVEKPSLALIKETE